MKKQLFKVFLGFVVVFVILGGFITFNFKEKTLFSCEYSEKTFPIPNTLVGTDIIFESSVYYWEDKNVDFQCIPSLKETNKTVKHIWMQKDSLSNREIQQGTKFTLYRIITVDCDAIICMGGGGMAGVLLKDQNGELYSVKIISHFDKNEWSSLDGKYLYKAGYYKNGLRIGDFGEVILQEDIWK